MVSDCDEVVQRVCEVAGDVIGAHAVRVDRDREFPTESIRALVEVGGMGLLVPRAQGGSGADLCAFAEACEAIGAACASTGMIYVMHAVAAATLASGGGEPASGYLPGMASGLHLGTLAFSERGTGAHFYAPELRAVRDKDRVLISGRKSFVTSGGHADIYLVLVQSTEEEGLDCFVVEREAPGMRFDGAWDGLGMAGNASVAMELSDVFVSDSVRVGSAGAASELVFSVVAPLFLVGLAAVNVGIAKAALESASRHVARPRYADGKPLAEVQFIQHQLADMAIALHAAQLLVSEAARLGAQEDARALVTIMEAKVCATECAAEVTQRALEVCGGQGYGRAMPIERHLRDARAGAVMAPTNAVLRSWIGKSLAGLPVP